MSNGVISIGEAASCSGVPPKTIRYYEEIGLIAPAERLQNRYRAYDDKDVQTLRFIQRAAAWDSLSRRSQSCSRSIATAAVPVRM
jgi:MerR family regulatory protein